MKSINLINRTLKKALLTSAIASVLHGGNAIAEPYAVSDLGTLVGSRFSLGLGANDIGDVVGLGLTADHQFNQAIEVQINSLPQPIANLLGGNHSQAYDINNLNQVTGLSYLPGDLNYHAFVWDGFTVQDLGTLEAIANTGNSQGLHINDLGQVAGVSSIQNSSAEHAVVWNKVNGVWTKEDLGTLAANGSGRSRANAINESGTAAGYSTVATGLNHHAVVWKKINGVWAASDVGTLGGARSVAVSINNSGQLAGSSTTLLDAQTHAFVADTSQQPLVLTDLKTLGGIYSEARAINANGVIVGYSTLAGEFLQSAFIWSSTSGMSDLNALIPAGTGWRLLEANAISDSGVITGIGLLNGEKHGFILEPTDTTPPVVSFKLTPASPNPVTGWYQTSPSIVWSVTDPESVQITKNGCTDIQAIADTPASGQTLSCSASSAGGTTNSVTSIKVDTTAPTITPPAATSAQLNGATSIPVTFAAPVVSDTVPGSGINAASTSCTPASGSSFNRGVTPVTCTAADNAGNSRSASFNVTVTDPTAPVVTPVITGLAGTNNWYRSDVILNWNVTEAESPETLQKTGCLSITQTANTNATGVTSSCAASSAGGSTPAVSRMIRVDSTAPVVTVPRDTTATLNGSSSTVVNFGTASASDPTPGSGLASTLATCSPVSGSSFSAGVNTVTCRAVDIAGNTGSSTFRVTVTDPSPPTIAPVITGTLGNNNWYRSPVTLNWNVTELESPQTLVKTGCAGLNQSTDSVGVTDTCAASSAGGQRPGVSQTLRVDVTAPSITVPASITAEATSATGAVVTWPTPSVTEATSGLTAAGLTCSPVSGSTFVLGTRTVSCSASDNAGNAGSASFTVTVRDTTRPSLNLPANMAVSTTNAGGTAVTYSATATDSVSGAVPVTCLPGSGSTFQIGATTVNCSASDQAGNSATGSFSVTVTQTAPPPPAETITVSQPQCKRINATSGEWKIQGTTSVITNNSIQLYATASVPADLTTNKLGGLLTLNSKGQFAYQAKAGPACISPISLRSAVGNVRNNIAVAVQ